MNNTTQPPPPLAAAHGEERERVGRERERERDRKGYLFRGATHASALHPAFVPRPSRPAWAGAAGETYHLKLA
ncbi:hypothetical protein F2Q68_00033630 [Brassica cretica]|uniref:Uncharacterized protein n=1 Tax=Brassica cretica TaxID=69181 RepID=A0A8S9GW94_BRACR|nr:hypothetical protein F2Q68_00033630 [Brassica cretica]